MTEPRPKISLFKKPEPAPSNLRRPVRPCARVIPITVVSRRAIEAVVAEFNRTATGAE